jgi:hypothetical protein
MHDVDLGSTLYSYRLATSPNILLFSVPTDQAGVVSEFSDFCIDVLRSQNPHRQVVSSLSRVNGTVIVDDVDRKVEGFEEIKLVTVSYVLNLVTEAQSARVEDGLPRGPMSGMIVTPGKQDGIGPALALAIYAAAGRKAGVDGILRTFIDRHPGRTPNSLAVSHVDTVLGFKGRLMAGFNSAFRSSGEIVDFTARLRQRRVA